VTDRDKQIEECAVLLAKLYSSERDYPFWGNETYRFRKVVADLVNLPQPTELCLIDTKQDGWPVVWRMSV
jgi:hypothetical protein